VEYLIIIELELDANPDANPNPRSYDLSDKDELHAFIEDFRLIS